VHASNQSDERLRLEAVLEYFRRRKGKVRNLTVPSWDRIADLPNEILAVRAMAAGCGISIRSESEPSRNDSSEERMERLCRAIAKVESKWRSEQIKYGLQNANEHRRRSRKKRPGLRTEEAGVDYRRVSTPEQVRKGYMRRQKRLCDEYRPRRGTKRLRIFRERGISGRTLDRPKLWEMIRFCIENRDKVDHVLVSDLSRLSQTWEGSHGLRGFLAQYGIRVVSATERTGDDPESRYCEDLAIAKVQYENRKRSLRARKSRADRRKAGRLPPDPKCRARRTKDNTLFPLRGDTFCESCGAVLRASTSTGNGGAYDNYYCTHSKCDDRMSVPKEKLEGGFLWLLDNLRISTGRRKAWIADIREELKRNPCEGGRRKTILRCFRDRNPEWGWIWFLLPLAQKQRLQKSLFHQSLSYKHRKFLIPEVCSDFRVPNTLAVLKPRREAKQKIESRVSRRNSKADR